jgi:hypothetical protein
MKKLLCLLLVLALMLCGCLPRGDVSTLSGDELVVALAFPVDDVSSMSPERKAAYTAACLELEVMNGGLCQFFANCPDCVPYVPEALEAIGAVEHKALYEQFLVNTGIDPLDPVFQTEDMDAFSRLYELWPWEDFDDTYLSLTPIPELLEAYVQSNPDAF